MKKIYFLFLFSLISFLSLSQGTETFTNIPTLTPASYLARTWVGDNGLTWTATDARTDQLITGKAITVRVGNTKCLGIPNGIGNLSFKHQQVFTGSSPILQIYINNVLIGTANPTTTIATATFSNIDVSGNFDLEIRQITAGLRISIDDVTWTSYNAISCAEPTAQPTNLLLSATANAISGAFDLIPPTTTVQNYLVVRSLTSPLTQLPVDGTSYTSGQIIGGGNGTSIGISADGTFTDNALSPSTQYYYFIFAMEDQLCGGPNYNQLLPLTADIITPALASCTTPITPTALALTPANTSVSGSFTGSGASKYLVVKSATVPPLGASAIDGISYTVGQVFGNGTVVSIGTSTTFVATGLTVATTYYFYVFALNDACTGAPFYSTTSLDGTATTTNAATGIPAGYYNAAASLSCQPLKTALKNIITTGSQVLGYTPGVWNIYQFSDMHRNDANTADIMWDMYSDNPTGPEPYVFRYGPTSSGGNQCGTYVNEGDCYNREHSTPQSWFGSINPMVSDVHHIFATDGKVNGLRSNFPYGEVTTASTTSLNGSKLGTGNNFGYTGTVFEPINAYKGDFARAGLYMITRYEDEVISQNWSGQGTGNTVFLSTTDEPNAANRRLQMYDAYYLKTLIKWHNQDAVSQKEIDRNNAIYYTAVNTPAVAQANRNPYVDHPEYVALIFQCTGLVPVTLIDFNAQKNKETVLLRWYATQETLFKKYEIESSIDGNIFNTIGEVEGKNLANYNFTDNNLPRGSVVYYRLKMIDIDGRFTNSKIVSVKLNSNLSNALVYPNPTIESLNIKLYEALHTNSTLQVTDIVGKLVMQQTVYSNEVNIKLDVKSLSAGRYFIKIANNTQIINQSFVVMK